MSRSLLRSTYLMSGNTLLSRILGFVRMMVFAHLFGAAAEFDAFVVALKIPNLMRKLFAEGAFSQAFVPVLSQYRAQKDSNEIRNFIGYMSGSLSLILIVLTVIAIVAAPYIIHIFAPGFSTIGPRFPLATSMLRITFPYLLLISLAAFAGAVLNTYDSFGVPAFTPVLLNLTLIFMAVVISPFFKVPVYALAFGMLLAGIIQLVFQLPFLYRKKLLSKPRINFKDPGVKRVLKLVVPAIFGVSVAQLGILIDTIFASFLKIGSVAWLYYSDRLMGFPLGVFGVAIATVILPKLSKHHVNKDSQSYSKTLDWALRLLLVVGIPSVLGIFILSGPLISTLFLGDKFTSYDVLMTQQSLMAFAVGLQAFMLIKILASAFYARQDIKTPVKVGVIAVIVNIVLNIALIIPLKHAGLALATSLAAFVNSGLLFVFLLKRKIYQPQSGWSKYFIQLIFANLFMSLFLFFASNHLDKWFMQTFIWRLGHLFFLVTVGAGIYFACLFLSGLRISDFKG